MIESKLVPSMYGMPIIGEFSKEKNDFGGHGGKTTITDDGIEFEQTSVAYGFIPESSQMRWESVKEVNGTYRDYLVCDAYVWYKRFPELEISLEQPNNQSMEIDIKDARWNEGMQSYEIMDAELTGLCVLGKDVEPCFESAKIGRFSLEKMKYDLAEMAQELKEAIKSEVKTDVKEFENQETEVVEETVEVTEVVTVEVVEEEAEKVEEETAEETVEETTEEETQEEVQPEEAKEEVAEEVEEVQEETPVDEEAPVEEPVKEEEPETVEETVEEEAPTTEETAEEFSKEQIEAMQAELAELREFKNAHERAQKEELMRSFENELTEEELAPVKEAMDNLTTEEVETQCFALLGKKKMNFSVAQPTVNKEVVAIGDNFAHEDETLPAWARAIQRHTTKRQ